MSAEPKPRGLLAEYLEAATEEHEAWRALSDPHLTDALRADAFSRWRRAIEVSRSLALRWQHAVAGPPKSVES